MSDAILIFTFSPVQGFIAEARRAADLYAGSQILISLAQAAAKSIGKKNLIYPAEITDDVPNKLVARVPWNDCQAIAKAAGNKLIETWQDDIARPAGEAFLKRISKLNQPGWFKGTQQPLLGNFDPEWDAIWSRQTDKDYLWEIYWAAVELPGEEAYAATYAKAEQALASVKRTRQFVQIDEPGVKDSLSGRRQSLRTKDQSAADFWREATKTVDASKLRSGERLDSIGIIKRFRQLDSAVLARLDPYLGFPSTSSVASSDFLKLALENAKPVLEDYCSVLKTSFPQLYNVRNEPAWPFDGDLLYQETLTARRLTDDYGLDAASITPAKLHTAQKALEALSLALKGEKPSPYYAMIALDGDNMGARVTACKKAPDHTQLSQDLAQFAQQVPGVAQKHQAYVIYNGGDDVLAMAPLSNAFEFARELALKFNEKTQGTASAGIVIAHHQSPLSATLRAARGAEEKAKHFDDDKSRTSGQLEKAAVCVTVIRRSGEIHEMRSKWDAVGDLFAKVVGLLKEYPGSPKQPAALSSKLAYDVQRSAYPFLDAKEEFESELKRLIGRHRNGKHPHAPDAAELSKHLCTWAATMPRGPEELASWLLFARFVAQGGGE